MKWLLIQVLALALLFTLVTDKTASAQDRRVQTVYEYVLVNADASVDDVAQQISDKASALGWNVLSKSASGVPDGCDYRAIVLSLVNPAYADELLSINRETAPFAIVDRINVFEDERGVNVSIVNPHSVNRTVLMDDDAYFDLSEGHRMDLRGLILGGAGGTQSTAEYGQQRSRGYIGKTMGVMAGGLFADKIQEKAFVADGDLQATAQSVRDGLSRVGEKWGLVLTYEAAFPKHDLVLFGSTGAPMEAKSFAIVGDGSDKSRKDFACPGLAHAGAYPIEVLVIGKEDGVSVQFVDAMYRMKMYFEDAGKMAFMKNMTMPGSLADELRDQIRSQLGVQN